MNARSIFRWSVLVAIVLGFGVASADSVYPKDWPYPPIITPNGYSLPWTVKDGVKEFKLVAEEIQHEMAPGTVIKAWGFNGGTPGPTIEVVQGDRVRILMENRLPEIIATHWHGLILPSGMDGVSGLTQPGIEPGETFVYEFTINQEPGTQMYHAHADEMVQIGMGSMGFFIIHPKDPSFERVDRDFAIFLNEWDVEPGSSTPDISEMTDFNLFTFNGRIYPGTDPLIAKTGQRVRFRLANAGQDSHPIHVHGHNWTTTGTDGGPIPKTARIPDTTVLVAPGQTRDVVIEKAIPGDWAFHCHRRHHPMNAMGHGIPNMLGVDQSGLEERIQEIIPDYMAMGETGMEEHSAHASHMPHPENTVPMMNGEGPFGRVSMGGMFTVLKVRDSLTSYTDDEAGWFDNPPGTVAYPLPGSKKVQPTEKHEDGSVFVCPMHPEVVSNKPGKCPKCGMSLKKKADAHPGDDEHSDHHTDPHSDHSH